MPDSVRRDLLKAGAIAGGAFGLGALSRVFSDASISPSNVTIGSSVFQDGSLASPASYIVFKDGSTIKARNGKTGQVEFSGTDAATVIQSAIDAMTSGGLLCIADGSYTGSFPVELGSNIHVRGMGYATQIDSGASNAFNITGTAGTRKQKVTIEAVNFVGGARAINASYVNQFVVKRCIFGGVTEGIHFEYVHQFLIDGNLCSGTGSYGIYASGGAVSDIADGVLRSNWIFSTATNDGIYIKYGDAVHLIANTCNNNAGRGIYLDYCVNSTLEGDVADGNGDRGIHCLSCDRLNIIGVYCGINHGEHGLTIADCEGVTVLGGSAVANDYIGLIVYGGNDITIEGFKALNNNFKNSDASYRYNGIYLDGNCDNVQLIGCISKNLASVSATQNQRYGIYNQNGTNVKVTNCILDGNVTGAVYGTMMIRQCIGYVTGNSGSSTGTGAQQTIAHGCDFTPTKAQVRLWNIDDGANPYQSADPDATNIYVTAVSGKAYGWEVKMYP